MSENKPILCEKSAFTAMRELANPLSVNQVLIELLAKRLKLLAIENPEIVEILEALHFSNSRMIRILKSFSEEENSSTKSLR